MTGYEYSQIGQNCLNCANACKGAKIMHPCPYYIKAEGGGQAIEWKQGNGELERGIGTEWSEVIKFSVVAEDEETITLRIAKIEGLGWPYTGPFYVKFQKRPGRCNGEIDLGEAFSDNSEGIGKLFADNAKGQGKPLADNSEDTEKPLYWLRDAGSEKKVPPTGFIV